MKEPQSNLQQKDCLKILNFLIFFSGTDPSDFTLSTRFIETVKQNKFSFSNIEINKPLPAPNLRCLLGEVSP